VAEPASDPILFLPGPTQVEPELRAIMAMPLIGHRSQRAQAEIAALLPRLQALFLTRQTVLFENCPATALMEAAIRNLVPERVLHLVDGAFSERWAKIAAACGRRAETLAVDWGRAPEPAALRERLGRDRFDAITITHSETSTGVLAPLRELAAAARAAAPDALILVDAVSSLAGAELRFDEWGLDLAFAGTQKCLALPPGLTVYAVSARALERAARVPARGWLLDFVAAAEALGKHAPLATPCVPLLFALSAQLARIEREGLERRWARHVAMRDETLAWAARAGMRPFVAEPAHRAPAVSAIDAAGQDVAALAARARAAGFVLDRGYGKLKDQAFRIGHMGDHDLPRLRRLLAALSATS
jgi:predicted phosphoserine aminotransferase